MTEVYLLWTERPNREGQYDGDNGVLVGAFASRSAANRFTQDYRRSNPTGALSLTTEPVRG